VVKVKKILIGLLLAFIVCLTLNNLPNLEAKQGVKQTAVLKLAGEDYGYPSPYAFYQRGPGYCRMSLLFDTLVWKDEKGLTPWLANKYSQANNGKQWTFQLNPQAKWHDGKALTAQDVVFTFNYMKKHPHSWFSREIGAVEKVESKGKYIVVFHLKNSYAPFLNNVAASIPILPQHIWSKVSDPLKYTASDSVVGSGPFKLVKYDKPSGLYIYQANKNYFKGKVKVNKLVFLQTGQPLLALTKGEIDGFEPNIDQVKVLEKNKKIKVIEGSGFWVYRLLFNLNEQPFNQVQFRQAVAYALNLPDIVNRAMHGGASPGKAGYISPHLTGWYNPNTASYPYNTAKAKKILDSMGYRDTNKDGIREKPNGQKLSFEMVAFQDGQEAELIKGMLKKVGIEVKIKALEKSAHDSLIANGQYQLAINGHGGIGGDPVFLNQLIPNAKSKNHSNDMFKDPEYMKLAEKQVKTTDYAQRKKIVHRMQIILAKEVPTISLYYRQTYFAYRPGKVEGWFFTPGGVGTGIPTHFNKAVFVERK